MQYNLFYGICQFKAPGNFKLRVFPVGSKYAYVS